MSLQHNSLALLMATAKRRGASAPADFIRFPMRIGGVWYCEVRHG
ncbi:hypothetical protein PSm6_44410 [Pseudomonas solani]|uniref:Uncharacterized protein n=1 Tax=Pseudomonas solani TaxID=2731552 RepID=A0ABN6BW08_9PSED|nr:hypothetical protein [Pseudomonas solani]BCD88034.1 hypothetical protein PSm6_44410 [Pseudomonas solani]